MHGPLLHNRHPVEIRVASIILILLAWCGLHLNLHSLFTYSRSQLYLGQTNKPKSEVIFLQLLRCKISRFQCYFLSKALLTPVTVTVILRFLPFDLSVETSLDDIYRINQKFKTLFLFHGMFADADSWLFGTSIELYAQQHGLAVVLPSVRNSFYADLLHGPAYWTFVSEELPRYVRAVFPCKGSALVRQFTLKTK